VSLVDETNSKCLHQPALSKLRRPEDIARGTGPLSPDQNSVSSLLLAFSLLGFR
jgi:hypothetical protein